MHSAKSYSYYYAALVILLAIYCTYYQDFFLYQKELLEQGQLWRLFSGHFVHLNNKHLILNLIAWVVIFFLGINYLSSLKWVALLFILTLSISIGLYYIVPAIIFYGGLSGVLHGYFAYILVEWIKNKQKIAWFILFFLIAKVLSENFSDIGASTAGYLDIQVVAEVHLIGVLVGILANLLIYYIIRITHKTGIIPSTIY